MKLRIAYLWQEAGLEKGPERGLLVSARAIVRALQQRGHRVVVVSLGQRRRVLETEDFITFTIRRGGLSDHRVFTFFEGVIRRLQSETRFPYLGLFDGFRFGEVCARALGDYDVLHVRSVLFGWGAMLAQQRLGLPLVLALEADPLVDLQTMGVPLSPIQRLLVRYIPRAYVRRAAAIVCLSRQLQEYMIQHWGAKPDKTYVIPLAVDVDLFAPSGCRSEIRARLGLGDAPTVIFIGGFYRWHGLDVLIEAFRHLMQQLPQARLLLAGDGQERAGLEQRVNEFGLPHAVKFLGHVPHQEVPRFLEAADVAVAPYLPLANGRFWNSPLKIYEYMAAGKAIVTTPLGQIADVIHDGHSGRLVPPGDALQLANAMAELLRDEGLRTRLGANARRQAMEEHSWARYAGELEQVYLDVLRGRYQT